MSTRSWELVYTLDSIHPKDLNDSQVLVPRGAPSDSFTMTVEVFGTAVGDSVGDKGKDKSLIVCRYYPYLYIPLCYVV